ncbi:extracellular solute-binding protein [Catellatospora bangladeshensis]|uniref:ABC transporter substrate-binding protein n=1 Tax=Catellatospora bangladeshensis TaxID=310355 RepID=UPI0036075D0E
MRSALTGAGRRRRFAAVAAPLIAAALVLGTAACGGSEEPGKPGGKVKLTIATFGEFGYKELYKEYQQLNPNVEITERITKAEDHHKNLAAHLATNTGAADIEAIEEGWAGQFTANPGKFYNWTDYGANDIKAQWPAWKWQQGSAASGEVIGLGTDVGGMAMCYRRDFFEKAGLPTDRDEVSKLWPTWEDYIKAGERFKAANIKGSAWMDGPTVMYRSILGQQPIGIYDGDKVVADTNPGVKKAWDLTIDAINKGLSAKIAAWSADWNAGMAKGSFVTLACPSWMMAYIQSQAKDSSGKWDIAAVPGGGGNWGGSFLTLPKQGKNVEEAAKLAKWLVAPEQQAKVFRALGNFPSTVSLYEDAVIKDFKNPFFNNAPVGQIFSNSVKTMVPQFMGAKSGDINTAIQNGLTRVEQGKQKPDEAWQQSLKDVKALL